MLKAGFMRVRLASPFDVGLAQQAWAHSRPAVDPATITPEKVTGTDLPVLDFPRGVFQVHVPALIREWLVSFRNHQLWSRSSRVDPVEGLAVYYLALKTQEKQLEENNRLMLELKGEGVHQDRFRGLMPMAYMADFSLTLSLRDFFHLMRAIEQQQERARERKEPLNLQMWMELWSDFYHAVPIEIQRAYRLFPAGLPPAGYVPVEKREGGGIAFGYVYGRLLMPMMLRAQLARHRHIILNDDLQDRLDYFLSPFSPPLTQESGIWVEFAMSMETARVILSKRQCWIAHEDLWADIIRLLSDAIGDDPADPILPCSGGACPFRLDIAARLEGLDPAPPCPKQAAGGWTGEPPVPLTSEQRAAIATYNSNHKPITGSHWAEWLEACKIKETTL